MSASAVSAEVHRNPKHLQKEKTPRGKCVVAIDRRLHKTLHLERLRDVEPYNRLQCTVLYDELQYNMIFQGALGYALICC